MVASSLTLPCSARRHWCRCRRCSPSWVSTSKRCLKVRASALVTFGRKPLSPLTGLQSILDRAALLTGRDDFGLRLGMRQGLDALGPLGRVMRHAATLGEALSDFVSLQLGNSTGAAVYLLRSADDAFLGYGVYNSSGHVSPQLHDLAVAVGCNIVNELTDGAVRPAELSSMRRKPADLNPYLSLGHCPIRFEQSQTGLIISRRDIDHELPLASASDHEAASRDFGSARSRPLGHRRAGEECVPVPVDLAAE